MLTADIQERVQRPDFAHPASRAGQPYAAENEALFSRPSSQRKTHILFVEDDDDLRSMTRTFLEAGGYQVWACSNGLKALRVHERIGPVDLLVSDVEMPFMTGTELAQTLTTRQSALNVLLTSGAELTFRREQLISQNGWRFLQKPYPVHVLLEAVDQMAVASGNVQHMKHSV